MKTQRCQESVVGKCLWLVPVLMAVILVSSPANAGDLGEAIHQLLSVGQAEPTSGSLKVWKETAGPDLAKAGFPAVIRVKCTEKAYLSAIYISSRGHAIVLLPNRDTPQVLIQPNREYTLFGPESELKLTESEIYNAKIVFYFSSLPLEFDPSKIPPSETFMRIPKSSKDMADFVKKLESLVKCSLFTKKVLALRDSQKKGSPLDLMGLPTNVTSSKPIGVAGVYLIKSKIIDAGQE